MFLIRRLFIGRSGWFLLYGRKKRVGFLYKNSLVLDRNDKFLQNKIYIKIPVKSRKINTKTYLLLLNTILPLGKLEVVLITTKSDSTNIIL